MNFREAVIPWIIPLVDPGLKYDATKKMMARYYKESRLYRNYDHYSGDDLFYGTYRGVHLKFSRLLTEHCTKGDKSTEYHDIFRGIFFVVEFNKEFHSLTLVKPDKIEGTLGRGISSFFQKIDTSQPGKLIRMENPEFEKAFVITTTDEVEARY